VALAAKDGNEALLETKEVERQEAAALLERKMAAMEASLLLRALHSNARTRVA
jgi:hypothetical protein